MEAMASALQQIGDNKCNFLDGLNDTANKMLQES
jgi:hypothetical protein